MAELLTPQLFIYIGIVFVVFFGLQIGAAVMVYAERKVAAFMQQQSVKGLVIGLPPPQSILFLAVNTALVALSEEWMFRGVLFQALRSRLRIWPAVALTSVLFGSIHVLNAFALGDLRLALAQAVAATMTGLLLIALMLRTGSIWTAVVYHLVWNFGILLVAYETARYPLPEGPLPASAYVVPILVVLPNFLYGLILLRRLGHRAANGAV